MTLDVDTVHATGDDVAAAFTAVTGKPAKFQAIPVEIWHTEAWTGPPKDKDTKIGFNSVKVAVIFSSRLSRTLRIGGICTALVAGPRVSSRRIMGCWIGSCRAK